MDLIENTKNFIASQMEDLTGEDDFMPFMLLNCKAGHIYVGLMMPGEEGKDQIADSMMAICAVHRATEAMFVSTAWMVLRKSADDVQSSLPVSQQADRTEAVFMTHHTNSSDKIATYSAPVIRENNTVALGEWTDNMGVTVSGRFGDAIRYGMKFGENLPSDMCDFLDEEIAAGRSQEAIKVMLRALTTVRTGASKN